MRRAIYLSGGLHKAVDPSSERILVRPGHAAMDPRGVASHARVIGALVRELARTAPEAGIGLLMGGVPGAPAEPPAGLARALAALREDPELAGVALEILDLWEEELEETEVPGGGGFHAVPVSLLECDALVNAARPAGPLAGLDNLRGLAGPDSAGSAPGPVALGPAGRGGLHPPRHDRNPDRDRPPGAGLRGRHRRGPRRGRAPRGR